MTKQTRKRKNSKSTCTMKGCNNQSAQKRTAKSAYVCMVCISKRAKENMLERFKQSSMMQVILKDVSRAGTLETYRDLHSLDSRVRLTRERRQLASLSRVEDKPDKRKVGNEFQVMHLIALGETERVGLTNDSNCLVGCSKLNVRLGKQEVYHEPVKGVHYLLRSELDSRWLFTGNDSSKLLALMVKYFGKEELEAWANKYKFQRGKADAKDERPVKEVESLLNVGFIGLISLASKLSTELFIELHYHWTSYVLNQRRNLIPKYLYITDFSNHEELQPVASLIMEALVRNDDSYLVEAIASLASLSKVEIGL